MATVVNTQKNSPLTNKKQGNRPPLFRKTNYLLMVIGAIVLIVGYMCLRGGAVSDPNTFDGEIFNTRRLVVAPILMFAGLVIEVVAIMWHPRQKKEENNEQAEA